MTLDLARFFTWTGAALVVVAAGVLAYGVHDLQEGGVLGGSDSLAFDISAQVPPGSWYGTLLKGTINLSPQTTVLQAVVWVAYIVPVMLLFLRRARVPTAAVATAAAAAVLLVLAGCGGSGSEVKAGAVGVTASDTTCETTQVGRVGNGVGGDGSEVAEVYVYGTGDRVLGEVENIGPGTSRDLVVELPRGATRSPASPA